MKKKQDVPRILYEAKKSFLMLVCIIVGQLKL